MGYIPMILISGSEDTGFDVTIKMGPHSPVFEVAVDLLGEEKDISKSNFQIQIDKNVLPMTIEGEVATLHPFNISNINMATGIYSFSILMDGKSILQGYFEWLSDDK